MKKKLTKRPKKSFHISTYLDGSRAKQLHIVYSRDPEERIRSIAEAVRTMKGGVAYLDVRRTHKDTQTILDTVDALVLGAYVYTNKSERTDKASIEYYIPRVPRGLHPVVEQRLTLLESVYMARDLVNTSASEKYPQRIVEMIQSHTWSHTSIRIIAREELQQMGANLLLAVGRGSAYPPYIAIMERIDPKPSKNRKKIALVGKGITFDAGGLQIKPDTGMLDMKCDMSGAAAVIGAMQYLDTLDTLPCDVVGIVALAENMLGGDAYKPLDIIRSHRGKMVEIEHTDAEGRLILADAISIVESEYHPDSIVTIATLTGACMVALGYDYAGILGDDEAVIRRILASTDEKFWRLPLDRDMMKATESEVADLTNAPKGYKAGASTAAAFLAHFVDRADFTHLDIAGPAYRTKARSIFPKNGTGYGVLTLARLIEGMEK